MVFDPASIKSQFLHIFVVVQPCVDPQGRAGYKVQVTCSKSIPKFGPPLPSTTVFHDPSQLREFLYAKLINGQSAALKSSKFAKLQNRTRDAMIDNIISEFRDSVPSSPSTPTTPSSSVFPPTTVSASITPVLPSPMSSDAGDATLSPGDSHRWTPTPTPSSRSNSPTRFTAGARPRSASALDHRKRRAARNTAAAAAAAAAACETTADPAAEAPATRFLSDGNEPGPVGSPGAAAAGMPTPPAGAGGMLSVVLGRKRSTSRSDAASGSTIATTPSRGTPELQQDIMLAPLQPLQVDDAFEIPESCFASQDGLDYSGVGEPVEYVAPMASSRRTSTRFSFFTRRRSAAVRKK
ncbi:Rap1 GTPase-activating protein 2 [Cladochytrium tenue]|nr:Rap1 GTPase-activating protein 2 [Cladochytrium tenue]